MKSEDSSAKYGKELSPSEAMQAWNHFASAGGSDKDRMVSIVTWLLAFSGAIVGYVVTQGLRTLFIDHPIRLLLLALGGLTVSALAAYVALIYGGYANRNWAKADAIAELQEWNDLLFYKLSRTDLITSKKEKVAKTSWLTTLAKSQAEPCKPEEKLPLVFFWFLLMALVSCVGHFALIFVSLWRILC